MARRPERFALLGALVGTVVAAAEGYAALGCTTLPHVVIAVSGAFGAGASLTLAVAQRRIAAERSTSA